MLKYIGYIIFSNFINMGIDSNFRIHQIDGKKYNFDADLTQEINNFGEDGRIGRKENKKLKKILAYNKRRNREKLILEKTTREQLEKLMGISGLADSIRKDIEIILSFDSKVDKNTKYPSIKSKEELLKIFNNKNITLKDIEKWERKGWRSVKVHYESGTKSTRVSDLRAFYENEFLKNNSQESSNETVGKEKLQLIELPDNNPEISSFSSKTKGPWTNKQRAEWDEKSDKSLGITREGYAYNDEGILSIDDNNRKKVEFKYDETYLINTNDVVAQGQIQFIEKKSNNTYVIGINGNIYVIDDINAIKKVDKSHKIEQIQKIDDTNDKIKINIEKKAKQMLKQMHVRVEKDFVIFDDIKKKLHLNMNVKSINVRASDLESIDMIMIDIEKKDGTKSRLDIIKNITNNYELLLNGLELDLGGKTYGELKKEFRFKEISKAEKTEKRETRTKVEKPKPIKKPRKIRKLEKINRQIDINEKSIEEQFNEILNPERNILEKIGDLFRSKDSIKKSNLIRVLNILVQGGKNLRIFQEYMNKKYHTKLKVDGVWGRHSFRAFRKFLVKQGTNFHELKTFMVINKKRQYELQKAIHGRALDPKLKELFGDVSLHRERGKYHGEREVDIKNHLVLMRKLREIYSSRSSADRRILHTLDHLSNRRNFRNNVGNFLIEAYRRYGRKIYQANGNIGGVRTLAQQRRIMRQGKGATRVRRASNSFHTKGQAIDLKIRRGDMKLLRLAAKHGLWNGAEMWDGFDPVHFQSTYSGNSRKKRRRFRRMKRRGTLPTMYS